VTAPVDPVAVLQEQTEANAAAAQAEVAAIWAAVIAESITASAATALIAGAINRANATAVGLADLFLSVQIETATGTPAPTTGIAPRDDSTRLMKAVNTILQSRADLPTTGEDSADDEEVQTRLDRLARSEPLETSQQAVGEAMQKQDLIEGWTRQMDADPCQLCQWWWREGRIWPKAHPFQSHKGCNCQPKVVLAEHIQSTVFTRRLERNARAS
jgi:hypothetical protein